MATAQELAQEIAARSSTEIEQLNSFLNCPIGIVTSSTNQDLEDLADEINALSDADHIIFTAELDNSGTKKGGRRPC